MGRKLELSIDDKKKITSFLIVLIFIIISLSGCEELEKLDKPNYISDSHGVIRINRDLKEPANSGKDLLNFIEKGEGKTMMLFHPQYWEM